MVKQKISFEDAVAFHGHSCPGLAIGFRAADFGMQKLSESRSEDEELVTIVENDACGVDAVQILTGCTFGKGNLVFRDYGKMAFTFFKRRTGEGIRVYLDPRVFDEEKNNRMSKLRKKTKRNKEEEAEMARIRKELTETILNLPAELFIKTGEPQEPMPEMARVFASSWCDGCGERMMETRARSHNNQTLCISCFEKGV